MSEELYDLIIIGGGPAGLSAGIYGGSCQTENFDSGKRFCRWTCFHHQRNCKLSWL